MSIRKEQRICECCGEIFEAAVGKNARFCSDKCRKKNRAELDKLRKKLKREEAMTEKQIKELQARQEHQKDTSVWVRDYAEKQRSKTLAMIGRIDVEQILSSRSDALSSRNNDDTKGILETDS